jgi:hypothetical protein
VISKKPQAGRLGMTAPKVKALGSKGPAVTVTTKRTGLKLYEQVTVHDPSTDDGRSALDRILTSSDPRRRLGRIALRAAAHQGVKELQDEIAWVSDRLNASNGNAEPVDLFALLAIERGLDVLGTGKHLAALRRDFKTQLGRATGAKAANASRAKLPPREALAFELAQKVAGGTPMEIAKAWLQRKYRVTPQAFGQRLKKPKDG